MNTATTILLQFLLTDLNWNTVKLVFEVPNTFSIKQYLLKHIESNEHAYWNFAKNYQEKNSMITHDLIFQYAHTSRNVFGDIIWKQLIESIKLIQKLENQLGED